jgi:hypothetical protein
MNESTTSMSAYLGAKRVYEKALNDMRDYNTAQTDNSKKFTADEIAKVQEKINTITTLLPDLEEEAADYEESE